MTMTPVLDKPRLPISAYAPPTAVLEQFELPTEDGEQLETHRHRKEINLLADATEQGRKGSTDFFAGGNMFIHFDLMVARRKSFRGPDFFIVLDIDGSYQRQSWVVWEEGGRYPDVIIELLSPSTADYDLNEKKQFYERTFRTAEYFCYDPFDPDSLVGWRLHPTKGYVPIRPNEHGWLWSQKLGWYLGTWHGVFQKEEAIWLRWYDKDGVLIPTEAEAEAQRAEAEAQRAEAEARRAEAEAQRAEVEAQRAEAEAQRAEAEARRAAAAEERIRQLEEQLQQMQADNN